MAVVNLQATERGTDAVVSHGLAGSVKCKVSTIETGAADSATSTYDFCDLPTNARILGSSRAYWDDLSTDTASGSTLDIGFFDIDGNITDNDDALNDGLDLTAASTGSILIKDRANYGKRVWELNGEASDPGGAVKLVGTIKDAALTTAGTITVEVYYIID